MTEIIKLSESRDIRPIAFIAALILAPLTLAVPAYALLLVAAFAEAPMAPLVPVFFLIGAAMVGAPTYLTFGAFFYRRALKRGRIRPFELIRAGLVAHTLSAPLAIIPLALAEPAADVFPNAAAFFALGLIFAPLWSAIFALLYERFTK